MTLPILDKKDIAIFISDSPEIIGENDIRPREAIEAAKKVLKNDTPENRNAAWSAVKIAKSAACSARQEILRQCHNFVIKRAKL